MDLGEEIKQILDKSQESLQCHEKLLKELDKIYNNVPADDFARIFFHYLRFLLTAPENSSAVERVSSFVCKFISSLEKREEKEDSEADDSMNPLVVAVFDLLLKEHQTKYVVIRYQVCHLLSKLLTELGTDATISEDLFNDLQKMLKDRLLDKNPMVRIQAVNASSWLQEPTNPQCPVIDAYLYHLRHDTSHGVRRAILTVIATSSKTLGPILERIRDEKDSVRKCAYAYLADKVAVRMLSIFQRVKLLTQGLNDRSAKVRKTVETKLLPVWMKYFGNKIEAFLHSLDIQGSSGIAEQALRVLFKSQEPTKLIKAFDLLDERHMISLEKLTCESAFHWRCLCQYIKSLGGAIAEDGFDDLVPDLTPFCDYIKSYILMGDEAWSIEEKLNHQFVSLQLLSIATEFDLADEAGRRNLILLVKDLLLSPKVNLVLIRPLIACFKKAQSQLVPFMHDLIEVISEIREPITLVEKSLNSEVIHGLKMQIAGLSVELNILRDQQENCIAKHDFVEAQHLKLKITELEEQKMRLEESMLPESQELRVERNDVETLLKCTTIAAEMLQTSVKGITPTLQALMETLVLTGIQNQDPSVRNEAVRALGLFCLRSVDIAYQHLLLFMQIAQMDQENVRLTALKAIFDILLYYGLGAFESDSNPELTVLAENETLTVLDENDSRRAKRSHKAQAASSIMSVLSSMLDSDISEVRTVVAENIGKLLFCGRVLSPQLFSRLIVLWYSPITEDDTYLRHCLGVFVIEYSACGRQANVDCVEEAFMLTLNTVCNAPPSSPLSKIDHWNLANFLIQLSHPKICKQNEAIQESTIHDRIAVQLCNEIIKDPNSFDVRLFSKILCYLELTKHNALKDLAVLANEVSQEVKDKQSLNFIKRFSTTVEKLLSAMAEQVPSSENVPSPECLRAGNNSSAALSAFESMQSDMFSDTGNSTLGLITSPKGILSTPIAEEYSDHPELCGNVDQETVIQRTITSHSGKRDSSSSSCSSGSATSFLNPTSPVTSKESDDNASVSLQSSVPARYQHSSPGKNLPGSLTSENSGNQKQFQTSTGYRKKKGQFSLNRHSSAS